MEYATLINGIKMPMEGFGVFQVPDPKICRQAVTDAVKTGYRLIDTAAAYMNEEAVGEALRDCGVRREDLFITTKLWTQDTGYDATKKAFYTSLEKLGLNYLDLYLIHQPVGDYYGSWRAMEELYREGKIRAIGVCNFYPDRLMDLCLHADIPPMVNQVELHPFFAQTSALETMEALHVQPEAWAPLAEGRFDIFTHPLLTEIGKKYGKTPAQVALRWNIQRGVVVIPKSTHLSRMEQNFDIWDFTLTEEEMKRITSLSLARSEIVDHDSPAFIKMISEMKIHN